LPNKLNLLQILHQIKLQLLAK